MRTDIMNMVKRRMGFKQDADEKAAAAALVAAAGDVSTVIVQESEVVTTGFFEKAGKAAAFYGLTTLLSFVLVVWAAVVFASRMVEGNQYKQDDFLAFNLLVASIFLMMTPGVNLALAAAAFYYVHVF